MISYRTADYEDFIEKYDPEAYFYVDEGSARKNRNEMEKIYWLRPIEYLGFGRGEGVEAYSNENKYLGAFHSFRDQGFQYWEPPLPAGTHGLWEDDHIPGSTIDDTMRNVIEDLGSKFNVTVQKGPWEGRPNRLYTIGLRLKEEASD